MPFEEIMGKATGNHFLQENVVKKRSSEEGNGKVQIKKDLRDVSINCKMGTMFRL